MTIFKLVPLKHLCREPVAYGSNISSESYSSTGIRFLRTTDITDRGDLLPPDRGVYVDERLVRDSLLQDGDLLLSRSGTIGRSILFREAVHGPCAHAGYLVRFRPRPDIDPRWLFYFSKTSTFSDQIAEDVVESTIANFNGQKFANLAVPLPPRDCQYRIADFLDRKTASIDTLIAKQEQLLELLAEKRQALITQAVTKGLDPNAPMKDSGVLTLGHIPAHWHLTKLRRVGRVGQGNSFPHDLQGQGEGELPWFKVADMNRAGNEIEMLSADNYVSWDVARAAKVTIFEPGAVIFPRVGAALLTNKRRLLTRPSIVDDNTYAVVPNNRIRSRFLYLSLLLVDMSSICSAGLVPTVSFSAIRDLDIALPPIVEQDAIIQHVEVECSRIDSLSQRVQAMIDKLRGYRQALITAAVTGQLEVTPITHSERPPSPQVEAV